MKTLTAKNKQSAPAARKARPYVHHPLGPAQKAQQAEIRRILHYTGAQAKLTIGRPDDEYEQEADRIADEVMRMPDPKLQRRPEEEEEEEEILRTKPLADQITPLVQRQQEQEEEEEEEIQTKPAELPLQRQPEAEEEEEELLQTKSIDSQTTPLIQKQQEPPEEEEEELQTRSKPGETPTVTPSLESRIHAMKGSGQPLPESTSAFFGPRFGHDFSHVRVHSDSNASEVAKSVNARAFTLSNDIVFRSGEYQPQSREGKSLLAHELTHIIQQIRKPQLGRIHRQTFEDTAPSFTEEFIQNNEEYYRDLIMAINEFGQKGKMSGQTHNAPLHRGSLKTVLLDWHLNATNIVSTNYENLLNAFIDIIAEQIFKKVPGMSALELDVITVLETAIGVLVELLLPKATLLGNVISLILGITVNHINEAMAEKELEERIAKFSQSIRSSDKFRQTLTADLYNLTTLLSYYQTWLDTAEDKELSRFRIPFSPELKGEEEIKSIVRSAFVATEKAAVIREKPVRLTRIGLFGFLQSQGIRIDNINIDIAYTGDAGWARIYDTEKFPVWRFVDPFILYKDRPLRGDFIFVYILPQGMKNILTSTLPRVKHAIVMVFSGTSSHAVFDLVDRRWLTGITRRQWFQK
jgi:hypothetical protein